MINTATELRAYYDKIRKDDARRMRAVSIVFTILILGISFGLWFGPEPVPAISNIESPTPTLPPLLPPGAE